MSAIILKVLKQDKLALQIIKRLQLHFSLEVYFCGKLVDIKLYNLRIRTQPESGQEC